MYWRYDSAFVLLTKDKKMDQATLHKDLADELSRREKLAQMRQKEEQTGQLLS